MQINEDELRYFAAAALSGYCANPQHATREYAEFRKRNNTSLERMSVIAAANICEEMEIMRLALSQKGKLTGTENNVTPILKEEGK